jgi:1,4-alpha-glucan branching enzyme
MAAAASLLLVAAFWLGRASAPAQNQAVATVAPAADGQEVLVRLVLVQPGARSVAIVGDFNGWDPMRSPLERAEAGVWSTTLELPPGRYNYLFLVDGDQWMVDPLAVETSVDGFGARNSVLDLGV